MDFIDKSALDSVITVDQLNNSPCMGQAISKQLIMPTQIITVKTETSYSHVPFGKYHAR